MEVFIFKRVKLNIKGIVQGVGFRPFVYLLAQKYKLSGHVLNNGAGVTIEIEGDSSDIEKFIDELHSNSPELSRIDSLTTETIPTCNSVSFTIIESNSSEVTTMIPVDVSMCKECKEEMSDPSNRRYNYPFINCTNCGPRYTIIKDLPYDRKSTSMHNFEMCSLCSAEYTDISNRRYHAQPISCFDCGPTLSFHSLDGQIITSQKESLDMTCKLIKEGQTLAIKGLGGFHLVCDATNEDAVLNLREKKNRPTKPLAVMFASIDSIKDVCEISQEEERQILSKERPIVIVQKKEKSFIADSIAPNIDKIGVFLPYTPLHEILLSMLQRPIVATSANISNEPIITHTKDIFDRLSSVVENVLTHDREILNACDDSVLMQAGRETLVLRMARGSAPCSLYLPSKTKKKVLALGANQKATISLAFENNIIVSPHIGDLNSIESVEYFTRTLESLKKIYKFEPDYIVCDKHPEYETTKFAKEYVAKNKEVKLLEVQHHYAHALACMAEYSLDEDVLAFCFDGTGYGDDGSLWGGEVFIASPQTYKRIYHFKEILLLGADKAIKEPKRVALALLFESFSLEDILKMKSPLLDSMNESEIKMFHQMFTRKINSPKSSSVGRLFDGVYALSGYTDSLGYEGESGLILESISSDSKTLDSYTYTLGQGVIDYQEMILEIIKEDNKAKVARKFLLTLSKIILDISDENPSLPVVLSGGVFQNKVLVEEVTKALQKMKRKYYIQSKTPVNDGGISLGQIYYALHKQEEE